MSGKLQDKELPVFIKDLLASVPRAGEGVHIFLFRTARVLHPYRDEHDIAALLKASVVGCGRHVSDTEIWNAIKDSKSCAWNPDSPQLTFHAEAKWPEVNRELVKSIIKNGGKLEDLFQLSPVPVDTDELQTEKIIDVLFPKGSLLCVAKSIRDFVTDNREALRGKLSEFSHIVPSPMSKRMGITKDGRESAHTLENTGLRRFLVIEFDTGTRDEHAALLLHLAERAPFVLAVYSGNKSLHGWFYCKDKEESLLKRFMRYAVSLGADKATWTKSQFVRTPDGLRDNGQRQSVFYINPSILDS